MKKILLLSGLLLISVMPADAEIIKVQALSDFGTENPPASIEVKAVSDMELDDELLILDGYTMKGSLVDVVSPKRLKRDATFSIVLTEYTDNNGQKHTIPADGKQFKGKFTTEFNYKNAAKKAALSVGNFFVKGLSLGYAAVEGAVKNEDGGRIKSSAHSVYESTPLSYVEKGQDILITKDQVFCLRFKVKDPAEKENSDEAAVSDETTSEKQVLPVKNEITPEPQVKDIDKNNENSSEDADEDLSNLSMAPTPDEEKQYYMTIEALQSEVLGKTSSEENEKIAFFGKKSANENVSSDKTEIPDTAEVQSEKSDTETTPADNQETADDSNDASENESGALAPEMQERQISAPSGQFGDEIRPLEEIRVPAPANDAMNPAASDVSSDQPEEQTPVANDSVQEINSPEEQPQKSKGLFWKSKSKTTELTPPEETIGDPEEKGKEDIFAETEKPAPAAVDNKKDAKDIKTGELHVLKEKSQSEEAAPQSEQSKQPALKEIQTPEKPVSETRTAEPVEEPSKADETIQSEEQPQMTDAQPVTVQPAEQPQTTAKSVETVETVAEKHLKRRDFNSYDSLAPELPAVSSEPLAPLDLPDTY